MANDKVTHMMRATPWCKQNKVFILQKADPRNLRRFEVLSTFINFLSQGEYL